MDWINKLMDIPKFGAGTGLHRIDYLCVDIQSSEWWQTIDPINIVGTNGKGSTAAMVSAILKELGFLTGQYTSPHLMHFSERIKFDGVPIPNKELNNLIASFFLQKKRFEGQYPDDHFGAFEAFTSLALHYFYEKKADALVLEAGIGGRFDPTRICTGKLVGLTSIELEHTQILGDTLEEITMDKIELAKAGSTLILGKISAETKRRARGLAKAKGVEMLSIDEECEVQKVVYADQSMTLDFLLDGLHFQSVVCSLVGPHQVSNLLLAVLLVKKWLEANQFGIAPDSFIRAAKRGLERVNWPGRFEKIAETPLTYIDIGHTPDAMQQLAQTANHAIDQPILLVFGLSKGRDPNKMLEPWLPVASDIYLTQANYKGADVYEMKKVMEANEQIKSLAAFGSTAQAIDAAFETAKAEGKTIIITGSLFLAIEAKAHLDEIPPSSLHFF